MRWPRGFRTFVASPRRRAITALFLVLAAACHVRVVLAESSWVPPEAHVGYVPLFALAFVHGLWWRQDEQVRSARPDP